MPGRKAEPVSVRFWRKVDKRPDGCWIWTGAIHRSGYATFTDGSNSTQRTKWVHRLAYELLVGEIPAGLVLDHLCRVPLCVNPEHLEPVTQRENMLRSALIGGKAAQTHCLRGHEFTPENTWRNKNNQRWCKTCQHDRQVAMAATWAAARKAKQLLSDTLEAGPWVTLCF